MITKEEQGNHHLENPVWVTEEDGVWKTENSSQIIPKHSEDKPPQLPRIKFKLSRPARWLSRQGCLLPSLRAWVQPQGERTTFQRLLSDSHIRRGTCVHTCTQTVNTCNKMFKEITLDSVSIIFYVTQLRNRKWISLSVRWLLSYLNL